jgi:hypothetical protein
MKKKISAIIGSLVFVSLLIAGCATTPEITKLTGLWKYDQYSGGYVDKVLVVGKPRIEANRAPFENYIAKELAKRDIVVIPSHTMIPDMNELSYDSVKKAAIESGVKAVLFTKFVGIDEKDVVFKQSLNYEYTMTPYGMQMRPYMNGPRVETFTKVRLETGLFEVASESLIWAAESAIMDPDSADEAIKDFSAAIIQQLTKDGFVQPSKKMIGSSY